MAVPPKLQGLFTGVERWIHGIAELDFPHRKGGVRLHHGAFESGAPASWPEGYGPKVFVYLRERETMIRAVKALESLGARLLVVDTMGHLSSTSTVEVHSNHLDLKPIVQSADLAVIHGGTSTIGHFFKGGTPLVLAPTHVEQLMNLKRLLPFGCSAHHHLKMTPDQTRTMMQSMLEPEVKTRAQEVAQGLQDLPDATDFMEKRLVELLELPKVPHQPRGS